MVINLSNISWKHKFMSYKKVVGALVSPKSIIQYCERTIAIKESSFTFMPGLYGYLMVSLVQVYF